MHTAVLLSELLKVLSCQQPKSDKERLGQIGYLARQSETVVDWIHEFNQ
jgi:hypothetical protein